MEKRGLSALCFCAKESDARNIALIRVKKGRRINNHWFCVNTLNIYFYFLMCYNFVIKLILTSTERRKNYVQ